LDHDDHVSQRSQARVSREEARARSGFIIGNSCDVAAAFAQHALEELLIFLRIGTSKTSRRDHDGGAACRERAEMRRGIDPLRAAG
jgi:hypothetical protein